MGKRKERRWLPELTTKAKVIFGLVAFVFVAAIAVFVVTSMLRQQSLAGGSKDYKFADMDAEARQRDARNTAAKAIDSGDEKEAKAIYEQAVAAEPDGTKKVLIAIDYSQSLVYTGQDDEALEVTKKAESYSTDKYLIYDWYARLYVYMKRYNEAIDYYKKASELSDSSTNTGSYSKAYYDQRITDMQEKVR